MVLEGRRGGALGFLQTALSTLAIMTMYRFAKARQT
jgi:hypothetical protein